MLTLKFFELIRSNLVHILKETRMVLLVASREH